MRMVLPIRRCISCPYHSLNAHRLRLQRYFSISEMNSLENTALQLALRTQPVPCTDMTKHHVFWLESVCSFIKMKTSLLVSVHTGVFENRSFQSVTPSSLTSVSNMVKCCSCRSSPFFRCHIRRVTCWYHCRKRCTACCLESSRFRPCRERARARACFPTI